MTPERIAELRKLAMANREPWTSDGHDGYRCAGCQRDMRLRSSEYEPRGLCDECVTNLVDSMPEVLDALAAARSTIAELRGVSK